MRLQWWCSAVGTAWDWTWRAYPGVWAFVALVAVAYVVILRGIPASARAADRPGLRTASLAWGLALLWLALDWPLGLLGAGYLASAHMLQFLIIALIVPPLLWYGLPRAVFARWLPPHRPPRIATRGTHPLLTLLGFNAVVIATHLPAVTDALMATQLGSFAIDTLWLGAGLFYWFPVVAPAPVRPRFGRPVKMAYLFANMVFMTAPGAMLTFADLPMYGVYELAPPIGWLSPLDDQRLAGLLMKIGGGLVSWTAISVLFVRWNRDETRLMTNEMDAAVRGGRMGLT